MGPIGRGNILLGFGVSAEKLLELTGDTRRLYLPRYNAKHKLLTLHTHSTQRGEPQNGIIDAREPMPKQHYQLWLLA
jgi:hypothetical protein